GVQTCALPIFIIIFSLLGALTLALTNKFSSNSKSTKLGITSLWSESLSLFKLTVPDESFRGPVGKHPLSNIRIAKHRNNFDFFTCNLLIKTDAGSRSVFWINRLVL